MKVGILAGGFETRLAEETESLHAFKPQWTARRGVAQRYEALGTIGLLLEEFEGERFRRIAHAKKADARMRTGRAPGRAPVLAKAD
ncbi:hypothetical protein [Mesorhizobium sp.]|uniref:hypothetical protein n=1 Tax=Mesorhizobium sp. TaxID=1871066 RepID=UPI00257E92FC|nr:hypothetical protein [Mesorhizobium sp.]